MNNKLMMAMIHAGRGCRVLLYCYDNAHRKKLVRSAHRWLNGAKAEHTAKMDSISFENGGRIDFIAKTDKEERLRGQSWQVALFYAIPSLEADACINVALTSGGGHTVK